MSHTEAMPGVSSIPFFGPIASGVTALGAIAHVVTYIPDGQVALRIHSGRADRPRDSLFVPDWKAGTLYGRYDAGWHLLPPGVHHLERLPLFDRYSEVVTQFTGNGQPIPDVSRTNKITYKIGATLVWGIPREKDPESHWQEAEVCYDSILLRTLRSAGEKLNDQAAQTELIKARGKSKLMEVLRDYTDPTTAESTEVFPELESRLRNELIGKGFELRDLVLHDAQYTEEQTRANANIAASQIEAKANIDAAKLEAHAKVEAARVIADTIGLALRGAGFEDTEGSANSDGPLAIVLEFGSRRKKIRPGDPSAS